MASSIGIGIIGAGVVGQGVISLLQERRESLQRAAGRPYELIGVAVKNPSKPRTALTGAAWLAIQPISTASTKSATSATAESAAA